MAPGHPVSGVYEHIFRGTDVPLKGCLLSRAYALWNLWAVKLLSPPVSSRTATTSSPTS
jgi:hypothetical protein